MTMKEEFDLFRECYWANHDPELCLCKGSGYALSDFDTWHVCPYHCTATSKHPEYDYGDSSLAYYGDSNFAQCLASKTEQTMPEDVTATELVEMEWSPAPPKPLPPLTDDDIPF